MKLIYCILFVFIHIRHLYFTTRYDFTYASVYWLLLSVSRYVRNQRIRTMGLCSLRGSERWSSFEGGSFPAQIHGYPRKSMKEQCPARSYTFMYTTFCICCAAPTFSLLTMTLINYSLLTKFCYM